jgi:hypothetical protein
MPPKKQLALKAEASKKPGEVKPAPKKSKRTVTKALPVCCSFEDAKFELMKQQMKLVDHNLDWNNFFQQIDKNNDNLLDFTEFCDAVTVNGALLKEISDREILMLFHKFDQLKVGCVEIAQFIKWLEPDDVLPNSHVQFYKKVCWVTQIQSLWRARKCRIQLRKAAELALAYKKKQAAIRKRNIAAKKSAEEFAKRPAFRKVFLTPARPNVASPFPPSDTVRPTFAADFGEGMFSLHQENKGGIAEIPVLVYVAEFCKAYSFLKIFSRIVGQNVATCLSQYTLSFICERFAQITLPWNVRK